MRVRVLVVDDHPMVRRGLCSLISEESDMAVIGEAGDGNAAIEITNQRFPDVLVMDVSMPDLNGIEATRRILADVPSVEVLCLSMHADQQVVTAMLAAGASGYVLKNSADSELVEAIRVVASHQTYLSPAVASGVVRDYTSYLSGTRQPAAPRLTTREREVLQLIAEGRGTADVAARLGISSKTVATHRQHIMDKVGLHNTAALTKYAIREGITTMEQDSD